MDFFKKIKFSAEGLVPVITQDFETKEVLMMAWANLEALENTVKTNKATYFSRSRQKLWCKGEESGNYQEIKEICVDRRPKHLRSCVPENVLPLISIIAIPPPCV